LCCGALGELLVQYPRLLKMTKEWTTSSNRWLRRAAAVSLIPSVKKRECMEDAFFVTNKLLSDKDDLVQKGYGWLLKEVSKKWQREVFDYVMLHKSVMLRTALRYAIEKMPRKWKRKAME